MNMDEMHSNQRRHFKLSSFSPGWTRARKCTPTSPGTKTSSPAGPTTTTTWRSTGSRCSSGEGRESNWGLAELQMSSWLISLFFLFLIFTIVQLNCRNVIFLRNFSRYSVLLTNILILHGYWLAELSTSDNCCDNIPLKNQCQNLIMSPWGTKLFEF